jgi:hypothetical protein
MNGTVPTASPIDAAQLNRQFGIGLANKCPVASIEFVAGRSNFILRCNKSRTGVTAYGGARRTAPGTGDVTELRGGNP